MNKTNAVQPPRMTVSWTFLKKNLETILSARTRDEILPKWSKNCLAVYKNAKELSGARVRDVEIIKSIGFYHVKARRIIDVHV